MNRGRMLRMQILVEQRIFWRNRSTVFFTFVLPLALLAVLALSDDPIDNLPVIIALGILSTGFQGLAIQLAMHRDQGVLKRLMATPLPPHLLVAGKVCSTMLVIAIEVVIITVVGVLAFGASLPAQPAELALFVLLGTATFVALGFAVASIIPSSDSAPAVTNAVYLGLILVTALLAQVEGLPTAVAAIGDALPLGNLVVGLRHAWSGDGSSSDLFSALVLLAWGVVATLWTVRRFSWEPAAER